MTSVPPSPPPPSHEPRPAEQPSPFAVRELAAACVRFVMTTLRFELDFHRDTLPVLDHYLAQARAAVRERPETLPLVASACGAYLGEVVRGLHPCWWRAQASDPLDWRLEFRDVYLSFRPGRMIESALTRAELAAGRGEGDDAGAEHDEELAEADDDAGQVEPSETDESAGAAGAAAEPPDGAARDAALEPGLVVDDRARPALRARLDRLPPVTDEEYWAPSTRLEVVDIVVDELQHEHLGSLEPRRELRPEDYDE